MLGRSSKQSASKVVANLGEKIWISPTCQLPCSWKCLTNQLWPLSYMAKASGHSAGKLLEKDITYMALDVRNSVWYLLAARTQCHCVQWLCVTCSGQAAWFICAVQSCASHTVLRTGRPHCVLTVQPPLTSHTAAAQTLTGLTLYHSSMPEIPERYSNHCFSSFKRCFSCFLCLLT